MILLRSDILLKQCDIFASRMLREGHPHPFRFALFNYWIIGFAKQTRQSEFVKGFHLNHFKLPLDRYSLLGRRHEVTEGLAPAPREMSRSDRGVDLNTEN